MHREISQNAPVQRNIGFFQSIDQTAVGHAVGAGLGVDTSNPKRTELTLALSPVAVGVLPRFFEAADGDAEAAVGPSAKAFGLADDPFVLG